MTFEHELVGFFRRTGFPWGLDTPMDTMAHRPHRLHTVQRCGLLLQISDVAWSVCLSVGTRVC